MQSAGVLHPGVLVLGVVCLLVVVGVVVILVVGTDVYIRIVDACREFVVEARGEVYVSAGLLEGVILGIYRPHHAVDARVVFHHDVEYTVHPLGIIFCPRLGDDFNLFHHVGGNRL